MTELTDANLLEILQSGRLELEGLLPWSSNYAFLVNVCEGDREISAVYKPRRGERPLWDFAQGTLCQREQAAFVISQALGWHIVPPTVLREGQHGIGTVQAFIDHDPERHYFTIEGDPMFRPQLQRIALLDILINNADRKAGHVVLQESEDDEEPGRLWGIDHGICFHTEAKLRTVIWEFAGTPIPDRLRDDLRAFRGRLSAPDDPVAAALKELLFGPEIQALTRRLDRTLDRGMYPQPGPGRHYPWPPV
jgi:uncharacterized repeat protein (TIGR03843 family)